MARNRHYLLEIKNIIAVHQAVGTHEGQATNEVLPPVHFTVDTVDPWAHPVVTFPIPERISISFPWLMEWRPIRGHQKFLCENNYTKHNTVIPGPILEVSANIENLKDTGTEIHQISIQLTYSTVEGKWVVENDSYCRSNQVIISIASAIPDVLLLMEKINTCPGPGMQLLIWLVLFSLYPVRKTIRSSEPSAGWSNSTSYLPYLRGIPAFQSYVIN